MRLAISLLGFLASLALANMVPVANADDLSLALYSALPGDTIELASGIYQPTSSFWITATGTAQDPIVIRAACGAKPVIDGSSVSTVTEVIGIAGQYLVFEDLEIRSSRKGGIMVWNGAHVTIRRCHLHHNQQQGIGVFGDGTVELTDYLFEQNEIHDNVLANLPHNDNGGGWSSGIAGRLMTNARYLNNHVYHNQGEGLIQFLCRNGVVKGNVVHDNYSVDIYADNDSNIVFEGNLVYSTGTTDTYRFGMPAAAFQLAAESYPEGFIPLSDLTYQDNVTIGGRTAFNYGAYQVGGGLHRVTVRNNTFIGSQQALVILDTSSLHESITFANNILRGATGKTAANLQGGGAISAVTWSNNLFSPGVPSGLAGTGNLAGAPSFTGGADSVATSFIPTLSSNVCGQGLATQAPALDFGGNARGNPPDIGAWECGTVTPTLAPNSLHSFVRKHAPAYDLKGRAIP